MSAITITAITQTGLSMNWIHNGRSWPLISCPSLPVLIGANENLDGSHCNALFVANSMETLLNLDYRISIGDPSNYGSLVYSVPCAVATGMVSAAKCTLIGWGNAFPTAIPSGSSCAYAVMPVCDSGATVSVGQVMVLRGFIGMSALIILLYLVVSVSTHLRIQSTVGPNRQRRLDVCRSQAEQSAREMTKLTDREWNQLEYEASNSNRNKQKISTSRSPRFETGDLRMSQMNASVHYQDLFQSAQWKYKVTKSLGMESKARRKVALFLQKLRTQVAVTMIFFILTIGVMQLLLFLLPLNYFTYTSRSLLSTLIWNTQSASAKEMIASSSTWIDSMVVADLMVELILLLISVIFVGQWPSLPVKTSHILKVRNGIRRGSEVTDFEQAAADGAIYSKTLGVVLLVRESCSTEARRNSLIKRIQMLLTMFPPDSIFVVDSHPYSVCPVDSTWETLNSLNPLIKYCFVPDTDSKLFALYWFNMIWLPFLVKAHQVQNFSHLLILGGIDIDDASGILPGLPLELSIPRENLMVNVDNIRAMHIPISASQSLSGSSCCWVPCQDFDLKLRAIRRLAESKIGSCEELELGVGIWEREALNRSLLQSSSMSMSPLQQLQSGLGIVKMRGRNHIKSNPYVFACTSVPSKFIDFMTFRFRNNYAGDAVKAGTALRELFSVFSLCNVYSWSVKPFLLLGTVFSGFCQLLRPFVVGTLIFRDPLALAGLAIVGLVLVILIEIILLVVFSPRSDLRQKWSLWPVLMYPVYRCINCWFVELPTLCEYIVGGCVRNASIRPEKRVRDLQDVPACPPCHVVNWFTVWKADDETERLARDDKMSIDDELEDTMSSIGDAAHNGVRRGA